MTASIPLSRPGLSLPGPEALARRLLRLLTALTPAKPDAPSRAEINRQAERLLDRHGDHILRLAYTYLHNMSDAEEVLQDTLLQFLRTAPRLETPAHEKAWLLRVAANLSKDRLRYNKVRDADPLEETLVAEPEGEELAFVWDAVKALPETYREVVHLYYYEGYSTAEIAALLHQRETNVRARLSRGRKQLREILKEAYDFEPTV